MFIYTLKREGSSRIIYPVPEPVTECRSSGELLEKIRTHSASNPFLLLCNADTDEGLLRHIAYCYPEAVFTTAGCLREDYVRFRGNLLELGKNSVSVPRILYIECRARKLLFYHPGYVRPINYAIKKLPDLSGYGIYRCNGSFFVNIKYVIAMTPEGFLLKSGDTVPISRRYLCAMKRLRKRLPSVPYLKETDTRRRN